MADDLAEVGHRCLLQAADAIPEVSNSRTFGAKLNPSAVSFCLGTLGFRTPNLRGGSEAVVNFNKITTVCILHI